MVGYVMLLPPSKHKIKDYYYDLKLSYYTSMTDFLFLKVQYVRISVENKKIIIKII